MYPIASVYTPTPAPINAEENVLIDIKATDEDGNPIEGAKFRGTKAGTVGTPPDDYIREYLPKDNRPMSSGFEDRYGNIDMYNMTGFYPVEHDKKPPEAEIDPLVSSKFNQNNQRPVANDPDSKFMMRLSKYGNMFLIADQGYRWKKKKDGDPPDEPTIGKLDGEFLGDFQKDIDWEVDRWKYIQRLIHEDQPSGHDQRRMGFQTRYGSKFEMRDVGWNKTRVDEYSGDERWIGTGDTIHDETDDHWGYSDSEYVDQRWIKWRSKGGFLFEMSDIGFDPEQDNYIKRTLLDEIETVDKEDSFGRDARFTRLSTRSGIKFVMDDRGSNTRKAEQGDMNNDNIGIGILLKGRRSPACKFKDDQGDTQDQWLPESGWKDSAVTQTANAASGDPKGYYWQIDERVDQNHTVWGSPLGNTIEISDKDEYVGICTRLPSLPKSCKFLEDNEFLTESLKSQNFEGITHHLAIDHFNEYIRLKTRAGSGADPDGVDSPDYETPSSGEYQGIEMHDGPEDKAWVELVDIEKRGFWFSQEQGFGIWRARTDDNAKKIYLWIEDKEKDQIVLHNNEASGRIQIYCKGNVDIIAGDDVSIQAGKTITLKSQTAISFDVGGAIYSFDRNSFSTNKNINATEVRARFPEVRQGIGGVAGTPHPASGPAVSNIVPESAKNIIEPTDRAV
jgi:hypothetical protein